MICQLDNAPCPANYFANHHGSCVTCGPNQRLSRSTNKCVACEDGMFSRGGVSHVCETCPHGMQYVQRLDNCLCKPGLVPTVAGGCVKCPLGRVRGDLEAGPVCERCYFGSVARNKGMETCSVCPEGMFQPNMGEAKCIKCPEGTVQETGSFGRRCVSTRSNCQLGFDRILDGDLFTCVRRGKCPTGTFERVGNMGKECATCPKGMRYVKEEAKCIQCGAREVSYGGVSTKCQECSRGMFRYRPEGDTCRCIEAGYGLYDGTCKKCLPGSFSVYYKQTCTLCPKGTFTSITGTLSACPRCPRNFFTDVEGATHCKPCPKGTVSYGVGESVCVPLAYS